MSSSLLGLELDHRFAVIVALARVPELVERPQPTFRLGLEGLGLRFVLPDSDCRVDPVFLVGDQVEPDKPGRPLQLGEEFALRAGRSLGYVRD